MPLTQPTREQPSKPLCPRFPKTSKLLRPPSPPSLRAAPSTPPLAKLVLDQKALLAQKQKELFNLKDPEDRLLSTQAATKTAKAEQAKAMEVRDAAFAAYNAAAAECDRTAEIYQKKLERTALCIERQNEALRDSQAIPHPSPQQNPETLFKLMQSS